MRSLPYVVCSAVWVNPSSTTKLMTFIGTGGFASVATAANYKAGEAMGFAWDEARDYLVAAKYVGVVTRALLDKYVQAFARGLIAQLQAGGAVGPIAASLRADLLFAVSGQRHSLL